MRHGRINRLGHTGSITRFAALNQPMMIPIGVPSINAAASPSIKWIKLSFRSLKKTDVFVITSKKERSTDEKLGRNTSFFTITTAVNSQIITATRSSS